MTLSLHSLGVIQHPRYQLLTAITKREDLVGSKSAPLPLLRSSVLLSSSRAWSTASSKNLPISVGLMYAIGSSVGKLPIWRSPIS